MPFTYVDDRVHRYRFKYGYTQKYMQYVFMYIYMEQNTLQKHTSQTMTISEW